MNRAEVLIVITLFGILFLASVDNQLLIPLLPVLAQDLGTSVARLGRLFSLYAASAAFFNLIAGPATDRYGRLPFLRLGLVAFGLLAFGIHFSSSYGQLALLRSGTGFVAGILSTCVASYVGDVFPYQRRGRIMGMVLSSYFLALVVGIPLSVGLAEAFSWRSVFLATGGLSFLLVAGALLWLPPSARPAERRRQVAFFSAYRQLLQHRVRFSALLTSFLISGGTLSFLTYISGLGFSPGQTSQLFLLAGLAALAGSPFAGWLSDRLGKRPLFLLANTAMGLLLPLILWLDWGVSLFALFFVVTLFVAARQTSLQTVQTELIETQGRGSFIALRNCFSQLGISICVLISGQLLAEHGYAAVVWFSTALTLLSSLVFLLFVPEPAEGE